MFLLIINYFSLGIFEYLNPLRQLCPPISLFPHWYDADLALNNPKACVPYIEHNYTETGNKLSSHGNNLTKTELEFVFCVPHLYNKHHLGTPICTNLEGYAVLGGAYLKSLFKGYAVLGGA